MAKFAEVQPADSEIPAGSAQGAPQEPSPAEHPESPAPRPAEDGSAERRRLSHLQASSEVIIAVAVVLTICYFAKAVFIVVLVSILLAFVLAPLVDLMQRIRLPRAVAAGIAVVLLIAALYGVVYFSYARGVSFLHEWPRYSGEIRKVVIHVRERAESIQKTTGVLQEKDKNSVNIQQGSNWTSLLSSAGSVTETVLLVSFVPFLVYFMLSWQEHVRAASVMLFKMEHRNTAYVTLGLISSMIRSFIVGNLLVGLFIGTVSTIVFGFLHLPYFYFLGYISGFLSLVPYLGVVLAVVPPVLAGVGNVHSTEIVVIMLTVLGLHVFSMNVLYPKFLGSRLQLNPLAVTLALLFWGWLWGAMGLILAVPITAATKIIFDHVESLRPYAAWLGD